MKRERKHKVRERAGEKEHGMQEEKTKDAMSGYDDNHGGGRWKEQRNQSEERWRTSRNQQRNVKKKGDWTQSES